MPIDRERQRTVVDAVHRVRQMLADPAYANVSDSSVRCENLAEILALVVADARADGADETLYAEIVLKTIGFDCETLLEARRTLAALGYVDVAALLKRLARTAPRRITWHERMRAKAQEYAAMRRSRMFTADGAFLLFVIELLLQQLIPRAGEKAWQNRTSSWSLQPLKNEQSRRAGSRTQHTGSGNT
jgi:hypothetical protein